jgi:hypothetical protein
MSIESIDLLWDQSIDKLHRLVQEESRLPDQQTKTVVSNSDAYHHFAKLYIKYSIILSELNSCYELSIQPQKRLDIKCTIERVVGRVIHLRHCLVKWCPLNPDVVPKGSAAGVKGSGSSNQAPFPWEYFDLSNQLKELSLTPDQLEFTTPIFYSEDQKEGIINRNLLIDRLMQQQQSISGGPKRKQLMDDTRWDAEIVPVADRSILVVSNPSEAGEVKKSVSLDENLPDRAAAKVQSIVRGHLSRKVTSQKKRWLDRYIGLEHDRAELIKLEKNLADIKARRLQEQQYRKERYENDLHRLKDVVKEEEGFAIQSMLREERIKWITDHAITKNMLPDSFEGFYTKDIRPDEKEAAAAKGEKDKDTKNKGKTNAKDAADNKGSKDKKSTIVDEVEHPVLDAPSSLLDPIKDCITTYETRWKQRNIGPDRTHSQHHDVDLAKDSIVRHQVKAELTKGVEEKLLSNILKIKAMQEASGVVKKSSKDKKEGKGKDVADKGKKEKKDKPLPGLALPGIESMTVDEMLGILVQHDLIFLPEGRVVKDFIGDFENGRPTLTDKQQDRWIPNDPSAHQLRKAVMDYCILPLGPGEYVRSTMNENDNVRSILFYGPEGCGKTLLVQAIASEIGAMVINLSSTTIGSSFRTNEEALKLIHMVFTVAKEKSYAPVLIYLDKCHEIFMGKTKRIPQTRGGDGGEGQGEERSRRNAIQASPLDDMNRFQKHLLLYKNTALKKEDRVLIVGITTMPELTDVKLMKWKGSDSGKPEKQGFFEHALYFPLANHSDRLMLWRELMLRRISKINQLELSEITSNPNLDLVALSFMSAGVSGGELSFIVDSILTEDRVNNLAVSPLSEHEFVRYFSRLDKQDDTRFLTFTRQYTNLDSVWKSNNPDGENGDDKRKKKK